MSHKSLGVKNARRNSIAANDDFDANKSVRGNRVLVLTDFSASRTQCNLSFTRPDTETDTDKTFTEPMETCIGLV